MPDAKTVRLFWRLVQEDEMNHMSLVSIIVPVYNSEKYLPKCLDSIKSQTLKDFECILVDDGSTDSSGAICDSFASADGRFSVLHLRNGGVSRARNEGDRKSVV